ncbi:dipeptidyl peptidase 2-like, partial [Convolutriloba macropyga]|uniref:dipeptidyl peptidase 2-like n=1 Tax=Convolutriloba macropyga TaxID=536237 RepID=UPI003F5237AF
DSFYEASGFVLTLAEKYKALVVFAEHRFYGESLPFGANYSFNWPELGLLTVDQATADFANLLHHLKTVEYEIPDAPVICFGGSYGGMLSAYMRFKYPDVVTGSLAASAPVSLADSYEARSSFWTLATDDFKQVGQDVVDRVKEGFDQLDKLASQGSSGYQQISSMFSLCNTIQTQGDYTQLLYMIRNAFVQMTMFDYPYPTDFGGGLPGWPVNYSSALIRNADTDTDALFEVTNLVYNATKDQTCFDQYVLYIYCADPTGCGLGNDAKAWDFQVCYELNLALGSSSKTSMFPDLPFSDADRDEYCTKKYGITSRHNWFGINYWGSNVWSSSNIIWSNGFLDPWHGAGILSSDDPDLPTVILNLGAHHLDLRAPNAKDPASVTQARQKEEELIGEILEKSRKNKSANKNGYKGQAKKGIKF